MFAGNVIRADRRNWTELNLSLLRRLESSCTLVRGGTQAFFIRENRTTYGANYVVYIFGFISK